MTTLDRVVRVSQRNGRSGPSFLSPGEQREATDRYMTAHGISLGEDYDETDSVSGKDVLDRDGLGEAVRRALAGESDGIIVAKLDRYARNLLEGLQVIKMLEEAGKLVVSAAEGISAGPEMTPQARLMRNVMLSVAEMERERLAEGLDHARQDSIARGIHGNAPFGYVKDEDTKRLVREATEARWVRRIFEGRAAGRSWSALADEVNAAGIKPRRAERFTHARIKALVERRTYLGEAASGAYVQPGAHEPLVSPELWTKANDQRQTARRRNRESFPLAGLIRCASCGVRMRGTADVRELVGGPKTFRYYRCRRSHSFGVCPAPVRVPAEKVEAIVEERFHDLYLSDRPYVGRQRVGAELEEAKAALDAAKDEVRAYLTVTRGVDVDLLQEGLDERQAELAAAQKRYDTARVAETGVALPEDLAEEWPTLEDEDRRRFYSAALAVIAVAPGSAPLASRVGVWATADPAAPTALPGLGSDVAALTPIDIPAGSGVAPL